MEKFFQQTIIIVAKPSSKNSKLHKSFRPSCSQFPSQNSEHVHKMLQLNNTTTEILTCKK